MADGYAQGNGDGRLLARLDERSEDHQKAIDALKQEIKELKDRTRDLELSQRQIIVIGSLLFAVVGLLGPPVVNVVLHLGGH